MHDTEVAITLNKQEVYVSIIFSEALEEKLQGARIQESAFALAVAQHIQALHQTLGVLLEVGDSLEVDFQEFEEQTFYQIVERCFVKGVEGPEILFGIEFGMY